MPSETAPTTFISQYAVVRVAPTLKLMRDVSALCLAKFHLPASIVVEGDDRSRSHRNRLGEAARVRLESREHGARAVAFLDEAVPYVIDVFIVNAAVPTDAHKPVPKIVVVFSQLIQRVCNTANQLDGCVPVARNVSNSILFLKNQRPSTALPFVNGAISVGLLHGLSKAVISRTGDSIPRVVCLDDLAQMVLHFS